MSAMLSKWAYVGVCSTVSACTAADDRAQNPILATKVRQQL